MCQKLSEVTYTSGIRYSHLEGKNCLIYILNKKVGTYFWYTLYGSNTDTIVDRTGTIDNGCVQNFKSNRKYKKF